MSICSWTKNKFLITFVLTICAFILNILALVTPYWIQAKIGTSNKFSNIGLFEVCFNGYIHETHFHRAFFGCFFIYYYEFKDIQSIITPGWFQFVQFIYVIGFLAHCSVFLVVVAQKVAILPSKNPTYLKIILSLHCIAAISLAISTIAIGANSGVTNTWLPDPEQNALSFSFATALICFLITMGAIVIIIQRLRLSHQAAHFRSSCSDNKTIRPLSGVPSIAGETHLASGLQSTIGQSQKSLPTVASGYDQKHLSGPISASNRATSNRPTVGLISAANRPPSNRPPSAKYALSHRAHSGLISAPNYLAS